MHSITEQWPAPRYALERVEDVFLRVLALHACERLLTNQVSAQGWNITVQRDVTTVCLKTVACPPSLCTKAETLQYREM
jgi:hypothetical protein